MFEDILQAHNDLVRRLVPSDRLLVLNLGDGWEPLCRFLGKPIPNEPFPRVNDAAAADRVAAKVVGKLLLKWLMLFSTAGGILYLALQRL